jgi:CLASP N terminal
MYMTPSRGGGGTPGRKAHIPEGPVASFTNLILETPSDQWQQRVQALRKLVDSIPDGSRYGSAAAWYNTPPLLRHLAIAIGDLLKDPRSTVVKRTCESLTRLFLKCQSDGRYLFKDLMPVILSVHAQTVQVIRNAVQEMVVDSIPEVPCKMVMPLWMERLKVDKSRTVRDACALYLGQALRNWTADGYLTDEIWVQVGGTLMRSLRDPSPNVRSHAKSALEYMLRTQPNCWRRLVDDEDSPAAKDPKLLRWLKTLGQEGGEAEELSVASKFSYNSDTRYARQPRASPSSRRGYADDMTDYSLDEALNIPMSIHVNTSTMPAASHASSRMVGTLRVNAPFQQIMESPPPAPPSHHPSASSFRPTPPPSASHMGTPPRHPASSTEKHKSPSTFLQTIEDHEQSDHEVESASSFPSDLNQHGSFGGGRGGSSAGQQQQQQQRLSPSPSHPYSSPHGDITAASSSLSDGGGIGRDSGGGGGGFANDDGPFIASMQELKKHAAQRRSRNSILMKQRFQMSGSNVGDSHRDARASPSAPRASSPAADLSTKRSEEENHVPNSASSSGGPVFQSQPKPYPSSSSSVISSAPEHMVIAIRLLRAHKAHVDQIMETLKIEMDALRDFDRLLEEPGRPLEEEVLDYFESVGLCLDQRTQAAQQLQREMDRISRGEPPQE